jgi:AraC-like DNA-binding protein
VPSITAITLHHIARAAGTTAPADCVYSDRIPIAKLIDTWEHAIAATGRRDLPGLAAIYDGPEERSWLSFLIANQPRFDDAIAKFQRYAPTMSDAYRWNIVDDADEVRMTASPIGPIHRAGWQAHLEFDVIDSARSTMRVTGTRARRLWFLHAAPPADVVARYAEVAGIVPEFGRERCELAYPRAIRDCVVPTAKPALATAIESQLSALLEAIERGAAVSARVRAAIGERINEPLPIDELARAVFMSRRSLERALADEGTTAAALIDDERMQRALAWLPALSVNEVAARLGYSDARAFARAFKRWTGMAPSQARARPTGGR